MKYLALVVVLITVASIQARAMDEAENEIQGGYNQQLSDPCTRKHCGPGKACDLNEDGEPICVCAHSCPEEADPRAKVCSTQNVTFSSECELYRQKCVCHRKGAGCTDWKNRHAHLDYFGECQEIPECLDHEITEYPNRMRQWLYHVMSELATRRDLDSRSMELIEQAQQHRKKWVIPVIWKFCDLDKSKDKMISEQELLPISAPLKTLEHCTARFLESCDQDQNGEINLEEWGQCLGLAGDEIEDLCEEINQ